MSAMNGLVLWTRAMATAIDEQSIQNFHIPALDLMERAGQSVTDAIIQNYKTQIPVIVLAGRGNNGGDALVVARLLHKANWKVQVIEVTEPKATEGTPSFLEQKQRVQSAHIPWQTFSVGCLQPWREKMVLIVDGVLGLGFQGTSPRPAVLAALQEAQHLTQKQVVAVDVPSGLAADAWQTQAVPLPANMTVTFGAPKLAHVLSPARNLCGKVITTDIGFASEAIAHTVAASTPLFLLADAASLINNNPWQNLSPEAHKYDRGHVLVLGGSEGKWGAPILSALAALRCGAGWATIGFAASQTPRLTTLPPDLTYEDFADKQDFDWQKVAAFIRDRRVRALVIGPGMMHSPIRAETLQILRPLMTNHGLRCVFDAGALHGIGNVLQQEKLPEEHAVLTPHPGEWLKLCTPALSLDLAESRKVLQQWGVSALYKSATPIALASGNARIFALDNGSNTIAKAGSGDVLSGAIAAHLLAGKDSCTAMLRAQALLYRAAEKWQEHHDQNGLIPSDLLACLAEK